MRNELYNMVMDKLYRSGMSKREFAYVNHIPRSWFIDFTNTKIPFRPLSSKTIGVLWNNLGIEPTVCEEYNKWVLKEREKNVGN